MANKLYHATFQAYLPEIEKEGLVAGKHKNWDRDPRFVYLSDDMDVAISFCKDTDDTPVEIAESGICCFEIDASSIDTQCLYKDPNILDPDEPDEDNAKCFAYAKSIPSNNLRLCWVENNKNNK